MSRMSPDLREALLAAPQREFRVIVRTREVPEKPLARGWEESGMTIHHIYSLVPGLAITAPGAILLQLADEPWVQRIEADGIVSICD